MDARLKEQACADAAKEGGLAARAARLEAAARVEREQAHQAWAGMSGQLDKCTQLALAERGDCILMAEKWLSLAGGMKVSLDAGVETVQTDCGPREAVFAAESQRVVASDVGAAEALLGRLKAADAPEGAAAGAAGKAGIEWVSIPGGSFQMGSSSGGSDEQPVHTVRVSSFALMKTEVTFGQYRQCVSAGACTPAHTSDGSCYVYDGDTWGKGTLPSSFQGDEQPVVCVDWEQAQAFAAWAGGRLPTEAEWEYAARSGGKSWTYPWGEETASCSRAVMDDGGNGCGEVRTWPVCSKQRGAGLRVGAAWRSRVARRDARILSRRN